jgi:hypothetical protein
MWFRRVTQPAAFPSRSIDWDRGSRLRHSHLGRETVLRLLKPSRRRWLLPWRYTVLCATAYVVGCRRSTDPIAQPIRLEISAPSVGLVYYPDPADHTTQNCKYDITARAIGGKAGEVVQWNDAFVFVGPSAAYHYSPYCAFSKICRTFSLNSVASESLPVSLGRSRWDEKSRLPEARGGCSGCWIDMQSKSCCALG